MNPLSLTGYNSSNVINFINGETNDAQLVGPFTLQKVGQEFLYRAIQSLKKSYSNQIILRFMTDRVCTAECNPNASFIIDGCTFINNNYANYVISSCNINNNDPSINCYKET